MGIDYITQKAVEIFDESEYIRQYGFNYNEELSVITEDREEASKLCEQLKDEDGGEVNIYFYDEAVKCDSCGVIVYNEHSKLIEGENICNDCSDAEFEDIEDEDLDDMSEF